MIDGQRVEASPLPVIKEGRFISGGVVPVKLAVIMYNSTLGAWALRRAGYATDSKYPLNLIDIIKRYDLYKLDETGI